MVNTINGHNFDEKQELTLNDLQENGKEKIAGLSDDELKELKQQALEAEDYDICKLIKQEQIKRAERERQTGENIKEEGDLQMLEEKAKIEEEKIKSRAKQEEEANAMKSLLDEPDDVLAKKFPWMEMGNGNNATYENDSNEGLKRRPRLNPERKDPYSRETLSRYSDGDVIDLYYIEGKKPISEQWLKEEGGYRKVENGKATEEFVTEQEMVIKMRDVRSSYKSETQLISSNTQRNGTETHENINPDRIIKPRPRLNPERKDPYSRETLGRYSDGDVIDLYYREGKLPISEQWLKEKGGYKKVENGKVTEEKITEEEMVIKMRGVRSTAKVEMIGKIIENSVDNTSIGNVINLGKEGQPQFQQLDQETQSKQNHEVENSNEYTESVKFTENIDIDYSKWNMSKEVKEYLDNPKTMKPSNKIEIDGQEIYITNLMFVGGNKGFLGFTKRNGVYDMNYYIKSNSEGLRRCNPGDNGGSIVKMNEFNNCTPEQEKLLKSRGFNFTKNFSYERTTMVDFRMQEILEKKYSSLQENNDLEFHYEGILDDHNAKLMLDHDEYTHYNIKGKSDLNGSSKEKLQRFIDMSQEINVLDDLTLKDPDGNFVKQSQYDIADVKEYYSKQTFGIDVSSLLLEPQKTYKYNHRYLGDINVKVVQGKMNGKDVEIFFSSTETEPDLVWVDQIQYKNQDINSYGLPKNQINGGWLTAKPIEYSFQTPKGYKESYKGKRYDNYIDIRPIYQESPLIKKFKELSHKLS